VQGVLDVSERRACTVVKQPRSSQRYVSRRREKDRDVVTRMLALARRYPRYGYRRIAALLRAEGLKVNRKRVLRLWRQEGLKVPQRPRKRRHSGSSANSCQRRRAERPNQVWSYDFVLDQTEDGRRLKWLPIVDEYTRECLRLEVARSIEAEDVVRVLEGLILERGVPEFIRSDNGPEFIAQAVQRFLARRGGQTAYIAPGAPWENAYSETFNSRLGDELLKREVFTSLLEARVLAARYREEYNCERPHSSLGYRTPSAFAAACVAAGSASLRPQPHREEQKEKTLITAGT
jgi:putative transposase